MTSPRWRCRLCGVLVDKNYDHVIESAGTFHHPRNACPRSGRDVVMADVVPEAVRGE